MKVTLQLHSGPATCEFWDGKEWGIIKTERGEPVCGCQLLREELEGHTLYLLTISTATVHMPNQRATGPVYFKDLVFEFEPGSFWGIVESASHLFLEGGEYTFPIWTNNQSNKDPIPFRSPDTEHALWGPQNVDTRELPTQESKWWIKQEGKAIEEWEDDSRTFGGWFNPRGTLKKGDDPGGDGIQIFEGVWRKKTAHNLREAIRIAQRTRTCAVDLETGRPLTVDDFAVDGVQPFNVYGGTYQRIPAFEGVYTKPWNVHDQECPYEEEMRSWKHHDTQHYIRSVEFLPELLTWAKEGIVRKWAARTLELRLNHLRFCAPEIPQAREPHNSLHAALLLNRDKPHQLGNGDRALAWQLYCAAMGWKYLGRDWKGRNAKWIEALAEFAALTTLPNGMAMARHSGNQHWSSRPFKSKAKITLADGSSWDLVEVNDDGEGVVPENVEACLTFQQELIDLGKYAMIRCGALVNGKATTFLMQMRSQIIQAQHYMDTLWVDHEHGGKGGPPYVLPVKVKGGEAFEEPPFGWGKASIHNSPAARAAAFELSGEIDFALSAYGMIGVGSDESAIKRVWEDTDKGYSASVRMNAQVLQVAQELQGIPVAGPMPEPDPEPTPDDPIVTERPRPRVLEIEVAAGQEIHLVIRGQDPSSTQAADRTASTGREPQRDLRGGSPRTPVRDPGPKIRRHRPRS